MKPIFNEKVTEKWDLWIPWTVHGTYWYALFTRKSQQSQPKKKKKKKKTKMLDVGRAKRTSQTLTRSIMRIAEIVISTNETMPPMQMYDLAS